MEHSIAKLNPYISFTYFLLVILFEMCIINPYFLILSVVLSFINAINICGRKVFKTVLLLLPLLIFIALINPLFNTYGNHILTYVFNRAYTLEALIYGIDISMMFLSAILTFMSFNSIMTTDKLMYTFRDLIPSISLMLSIILRWVPKLKKDANSILDSRKAIGKGLNTDVKKEKILHGSMVLSSLLSNSLEDGISTSYSMRCRGYGIGKRSSFKIYRMRDGDIYYLLVLLLLASIMLVCSTKSGMDYSYIDMKIERSVFTLIGLISYFLLLAFPIFLDIFEDLRWRNSK